jgi:hypothetical protein
MYYFFKQSQGIVACCIQYEVLAHFFNANLVIVALHQDLVFCRILFSKCGCISNCERCHGVCTWVCRYGVDPRCISNNKPVLWLGDGAGAVSIFLTLLVVVSFCDCEDPAELIFESDDGLQGDHASEACQFVVEGDQRVVRCIAFGGCNFCTLPIPLVLACFGCKKAC